jgi:hypothetical protein
MQKKAVSEMCQRAALLDSTSVPIHIWDIVLTVLVHGGGDGGGDGPAGSGEHLLRELFDTVAGHAEQSEFRTHMFFW